jgi:16S rRNA (adenine1518-N6/adenine1519-N6)-dimethyltransferase
MKPTEIKQALAAMGGGAKKSLGQHFLIDQAALSSIVDAAAIKKGDFVLEVGPGLGVLTKELIAHGAEVTAIEQDRRMVEYLVGAHGHAPVRIIHGDAADIHWHELIGERTWKFVANLPYSMTSLALRKALWAPRPPENLVVLVQREVGERAIEVADPKAKKSKTSLLSLMVALSAQSARIVRRVPAGCFYPPPKVESVVLQVVPLPWVEREKKWGIHPDKIMEVAKKGFAHPRKLLASNLEIGRANDYSPLRDLDIDEKARAEDLSPDDWARLAKSVKFET